MLDAKQIGRAIVVARKRAYLTQEEAAALSEISERTLRDIENGTGKTSLATVLRVMGIVGVPMRLED